MPRVGLYALLMLTAGATAVRADDARPPEIRSYIHAQQPYGSGSYDFTFCNLYQASLWTDAPSWSWQSSFALTINYAIHVTSEKLVEKSIEEMDAESPLSHEEKEFYAKTLAYIFPDIKPDDRLTAFYTPSKPLLFFYNGQPIGNIKDSLLTKRFLEIWLSEQTSAPFLRDQLLFHHNLHGGIS